MASALRALINRRHEGQQQSPKSISKKQQTRTDDPKTDSFACSLDRCTALPASAYLGIKFVDRSGYCQRLRCFLAKLLSQSKVLLLMPKRECRGVVAAGHCLPLYDTPQGIAEEHVLCTVPFIVMK